MISHCFRGGLGSLGFKSTEVMRISAVFCLKDHASLKGEQESLNVPCVTGCLLIGKAFPSTYCKLKISEETFLFGSRTKHD